MDRPYFSEMLSSRRRSLGLSLSQASHVLKLKEQVLIAFEEGDWKRIPRSGYAQGMLSSYARYLGLNPREVIDAFQQDLEAYKAGAEAPGRGASYGQDPVYDLPNTTTSSPVVHRSYDRDLYGSAGPAGSILTDDHTQRASRSTPLASTRNQGYAASYTASATAGTGAASAQAETSAYNEAYPQGRPYTARTPERAGATARAGRGSRPQRRGMAAAAGTGATRPRRDQIETRSVAGATYADDLTYSEASPYEQASTRAGRQASRNIATAQRPNVRRRSSDATRRDMRRRPQAPQRGGLLGVVEAYFSNPTRTAITFFALAAVVLLLIIVVSLKSCDNSSAADAAKQQVVVSQSGTSSTSSSSDTASSSTSSSTSTSGDGSTVQSSGDAATNEPTVVTVTVADGEVSWVEITNDDVSEVADTISGPWEQSYTVTKEIVIEVNDITAVTVTENGKQVSFDQKPSGLGSITIEGTPIETTEDATTSTDASGTATNAASTTAGSTS